MVKQTLPAKTTSPTLEQPSTLLLQFAVSFLLVVLAHLALLRLPYFWDEGGYYVPAALDFFHTGSLIPQFTNAHPPLPNVVLGAVWHVFGFRIIVTRLTACAFAGLALLAVFRLGRPLLGTAPALVLSILTGLYPIWFAQSSLAHADIFAAGFTLAALALYLTSPELIGSGAQNFSSRQRLLATSALFCLSVLAKETAVVQPAALAVLELFRTFRAPAGTAQKRLHGLWSFALAIPVPLLAGWFAYHRVKTGYIFGNPEFLRYNATANLTLGHFFSALRFRCVHLFWQRDMWLPLVLALACLLLPRRPGIGRAWPAALPRPVGEAIGLLTAVNLLAFSLLGGALLTRYLLPMYPLLLLAALAIWQERTTQWPWLAGLTAVAFLSALWLNPETFFAPEDNLTYRNMIVVQADAIHFLDQHYPLATVLTAWPVSADLFRPELGYTTTRFRVVSLENFTLSELTRAAGEPGRYDTAVVFTTHYTTPAFRHYLLTHPASWRGRHYAADLDLMPAQIAGILGGKVVWQEERYGEWAAVLRFPRSYDAAIHPRPSTVKAAVFMPSAAIY